MNVFFFEFENIISPVSSNDSVFVQLTTDGSREEFNKNFPINITSPTDD